MSEKPAEKLTWRCLKCGGEMYSIFPQLYDTHTGKMEYTKSVIYRCLKCGWERRNWEITKDIKEKLEREFAPETLKVSEADLQAKVKKSGESPEGATPERRECAGPFKKFPIAGVLTDGRKRRAEA